MRYRPVFALLIAASLTGKASAQTVVDPQLTVSAVLPVGSLDLPTQIRFIGFGDFLVTEKDTGRVRRVQGGVVSPTLALDLNVANHSERGLLGLELDPSFATNGFVYLYYSATTGGDGGRGSKIGCRASPGMGARSAPRSS